ncbi:GntR family transcriptional regulator [Nonomuraea sp. NPDC004580]|uniref:GntR family transcriptional regulator n=1 Tax=Nonomuraea sp. NPDC004580 TaxID=3154552 RepID=UPI0033AD7825
MSPTQDTGPARAIADALRSDIRNGTYRPGEKLPSLRELCERHSVSRNTAAKAITLLRNEGLVSTRYGSGAYVRDAQLHLVRRLGPDRYARSRWDVTTVDAFPSELAAGAPTTQQGGQTQEVQRVEADVRIAAALGIEAGEEVWQRARLVTRDGEPTHTMTSWYKMDDVNGTPLVDERPGIAGRRGGFAVLTDRGLAPSHIEEDLYARMPTVEEARRLGMPGGEPVVVVHRVTTTADGRPVEYARGVHRASRFSWRYGFDIPD